ncbi:MAG TPA: hypothetical protein VIN72_11415 [Lutibacter sp.]
MKKPNLMFLLVILVLLITIMSCQSNPIDKIQGVFNVDKTILRSVLTESAYKNKLPVSDFLDKAIENTILEFKINGDSIYGVMSFAGDEKILNSKIKVINDSMVIKFDNSEAYLIPNDKGLFFKNKNAKSGMQLLKSEQKNLTDNTLEILKNLIQIEKVQKKISDSLGKWQKYNAVDDFGDNTGKGYPCLVVLGVHNNTVIENSEVYVTLTIQGEIIDIQIFDKSMTLQETFPDRVSGTVKVKFPNGDVKNDPIWFYSNTGYLSIDGKSPMVYNHLLNEVGELKILIDLSTASEYYSDKYLFTISKSNLTEILAELK